MTELKTEIDRGKRFRTRNPNYNKEYSRRRLIENPDYNKNRFQGLKDTDKYKEFHKKAQRKYYKENPKKIIAQRITNNKKLRGNHCERCGIKDVRLEAHHFDYSKPNKIITLCVKCHKEIHYGK